MLQLSGQLAHPQLATFSLGHLISVNQVFTNSLSVKSLLTILFKSLTHGHFDLVSLLNLKTYVLPAQAAIQLVFCHLGFLRIDYSSSLQIKI